MNRIPKEREAPIIERHYFPKGSIILHEGDRGEYAYLALSGRVCIFTDRGEKCLDIATLEPGEVFGEMALFSKSKRNASVRALDDCNLMVLTRAVLTEKMNGTDPTIQAMFNMLMRRVSAGNDAMTSQDNTIETLALAINGMFAQALASLPEEDRKEFRATVQPILREFIRTVEGFSP